MPVIQSEVARYLAPGDPAEFAFVGFVDRFAADLAGLAARLGWPPVAAPRLNTTPPRAVSAPTRCELAEACAPEMEVYQRMRRAWAVG